MKTIRRFIGKLFLLLTSGFKGVVGLSSMGWSFLTLHQLRYKFKALRAGIIENKRTELSLFNFRRNIHRIEKGLSYAVRKPVFAEDYIVETVEMLISGKAKKSFSEETIRWGESVLSVYFSVDSPSIEVNNAKALFEDMSLTADEKNWAPYKSKTRPTLSLSYEDLFTLSLRRRSVRYFEDKVVPEELVQKALRIAHLAPSACNRQSFHYLFYNTPEIAKEIAAIPGGVNGYDLKNIIVVLGKYSGYFNVRDINAPIIDASLANMSLLYAFETLGLGTVCINWPNLPDREKKIRKLLKLAPDEFVIMMIGLGYPLPEGKVPFSAKRPVRDLLETNKRIRE